MELTINTIKVGDYVKVKKGTKVPDFECQLMDDWQGKVTEIQLEHELVEIEWDAQTLLNMSMRYLIDSIKEGYDYEGMPLEISVLEKTNKRNNFKKEQELKLKAMAKTYWIELFDDEKKAAHYSKLFQDINMNNYNQVYMKWEEYLCEKLTLPMETKVAEGGMGDVRNGDVIKLLAIDDYDDMHGIFGSGKHRRGAVTVPICDLKVVDEKSKNYEILHDYVVWFANQ